MLDRASSEPLKNHAFWSSQVGFRYGLVRADAPAARRCDFSEEWVKSSKVSRVLTVWQQYQCRHILLFDAQCKSLRWNWQSLTRISSIHIEAVGMSSHSQYTRRRWPECAPVCLQTGRPCWQTLWGCSVPVCIPCIPLMVCETKYSLLQPWALGLLEFTENAISARNQAVVYS